MKTSLKVSHDFIIVYLGFSCGLFRVYTVDKPQLNPKKTERKLYCTL